MLFLVIISFFVFIASPFAYPPGSHFSRSRIQLQPQQNLGTIIYYNPMRVSFNMKCSSFKPVANLIHIGKYGHYPRLPAIYLYNNNQIVIAISDSGNVNRPWFVPVTVYPNHLYHLKFYFDMKHTEFYFNGVKKLNAPIPSNVNRNQYIGKSFILWFGEPKNLWPTANCVLTNVKINAGALAPPRPPISGGHLRQCYHQCYWYYGGRYGNNHKENKENEENEENEENQQIDIFDNFDSIKSQLFFYKYFSISLIIISVLFGIYLFVKRRKEYNQL